MPSDIVLFGGDILGKGGTCKNPLVIRGFRKEVKRKRKNRSREEAFLGKSVVFGAKSHHIILNFWENTLKYGSCNEKTGKPPQNY